MTSAAYALADEAFKVAHAKFQQVRDAYHARTIGDAEFLAAKADYKAAQDAFDVAFDAEAARLDAEEAAPAIVEDDGQGDLF